ncbi:MAG: hypothetical protein JJU41_04695 [Bacteroidetes bacterium]|nr:hypothetical protein [Bacteroidota bacterium]MCH8524091.1 hypothetical protein [Balneolales bacterium]
MAEIKETLLSLSEKIVDLSENLESADPQTEPHKIRKATTALRHLGDDLLRYEKETSGEDQAYVRFMLGSVCQMLDYHEKAVEMYRKALKVWPEHVGILNELFISLDALEQYEDARIVIERSIKIGGETPDVLQNFATILVKLNRIPEAKTVLFNCISKFPNDADSQRFLNELDQLQR